LSVWPGDLHQQVMVAGGSIAQLGRQACKLRRGGDPCNGVVRQHQLGLQGVAVQIFEMVLDGGTDQPAQRQQYHAGADGKQQGQSRGERELGCHGVMA
jgi:hypothetical protein